MHIQDAVYGQGNDDDYKVKPAASRKRKTAEEEQDVKQQAAVIDFKVHARNNGNNVSSFTVQIQPRLFIALQIPGRGEKC